MHGLVSMFSKLKYEMFENQKCMLGHTDCISYWHCILLSLQLIPISFVPICRYPVKFLTAGWSLAKEMQLLRAFVNVLVSYRTWYLFTILFPLIILYRCIHFGMDSQAIQIWDSLNIRSRLVLQLSHIVLYYSLEGKFIPLIIYIDILRFYSALLFSVT